MDRKASAAAETGAALPAVYVHQRKLHSHIHDSNSIAILVCEICVQKGRLVVDLEESGRSTRAAD